MTTQHCGNTTNESLKELLNDRCLLGKVGKVSSRGSPQGYLRGQQRVSRKVVECEPSEWGNKPQQTMVWGGWHIGVLCGLEDGSLQDWDEANFLRIFLKCFSSKLTSRNFFCSVKRISWGRRTDPSHFWKLWSQRRKKTQREAWHLLCR